MWAEKVNRIFPELRKRGYHMSDIWPCIRQTENVRSFFTDVIIIPNDNHCLWNCAYVVTDNCPLENVLQSK